MRLSEGQIYAKADKCFEVLSEACQIFRVILEKNESFLQSDYYKARSLLREGQQYFGELLKKAKKLLGPAPPYVTEEFNKWRQDLVGRENILVVGSEAEEVLTELLADENLRKWLSDEKIRNLFEKHFPSQKKGKRKLANIKARILIDNLEELLEEAKSLNKRAMEILNRS